MAGHLKGTSSFHYAVSFDADKDQSSRAKLHNDKCSLTAIQACASIPHSIAFLGFPRACSSFSTASIIIVNEVLACGFRSAAPSSGTVGPKPLGYCSVKIGGMPRIRLACETKGTFLIKFLLRIL